MICDHPCRCATEYFLTCHGENHTTDTNIYLNLLGFFLFFI